MRILVVTNLYPPHTGGSDDGRCETTVEGLKRRGHTVRILTSNYGLRTEQRDEEMERRLWVSGLLELPRDDDYGNVKARELHNNATLRESLGDFNPELVYVFSLNGVSKSLVFTLHHFRIPTVYDVADDWLDADVRRDPWLRWWNTTGSEGTNKFKRTMMETTGQRDSLDKTAPTRLSKGYDRIPQLFGDQADADQALIAGFPFDRIYFTSQYLKQRALDSGFHVAHGEVIYPGVECDLFFGEVKPISAPIKKLLLASKVDEQSGVMTALDALKRARENGASATLTICGKGDSSALAQARSFVITHQLPVEFCSPPTKTKELATLYRAHDGFIHAREGEDLFPLPSLQAMACGIPVISTVTGASAELLRHGHNALTFTPGDVEALGSRIQELQIQPALRCQMAENAQEEVVRVFNSATVLDQVETFLNTTLENWQQ